MAATQSLRILLFPLGTCGDNFPFLAVGKGLLDRGHQVTFVANDVFGGRALERGLTFISSGTAEQYSAAVNNPLIWERSLRRARPTLELMLSEMESVYRRICELSEPGRTVVLAPSTALGARLASEKFGIPLISMNAVVTAVRAVRAPVASGLWGKAKWSLRESALAALDRFVVDPILTPRLNEFRRALRLPPVSRPLNTWIHSPDCVVGLYPQWFAPEQTEQVKHTQFPLFDDGEQFPEWHAAEKYLDEADPPVVFTFGTGTARVHRLFQTSVEVCRRLQLRGMLLTPHRDQIGGVLPTEVRQFSYVPLSRCLLRAAALVHHGGIGTIAEALRAGVPQLITPGPFDQPWNAARVRQIGAGSWLSRRRFTPAAAARKLRHLLTSQDVAARCQTLSARFEGLDPVREACDIIATFGATACQMQRTNVQLEGQS